MLLCRSTCAVAVGFAATLIMVGAAQAADDATYPNWKGAWARWAPPNAARDPGNGGTGFTAGGQPSFDQTKPWGAGQQAPLTPEYQKVLEDSMADQAEGGLGNYPTARCLIGGMPRTMASIFQEFVISQDTTYILGGVDILDNRRIYTDGRDRPTDTVPTFIGYSIGRWIGGRHARPFQGTARLGRNRPAAASRQSVRLQGAHLPRQGRSQSPA